MPAAKPLKVFVVNQFTPPSTLYSSAPDPEAFTTMVPVGTAHVGWVTVGAFTVGGTGTALITTGLPANGVEQVGTACIRTRIV